jgi:tRNA threonylcarbamoyladenosine biosynthesis protein TsaE
VKTEIRSASPDETEAAGEALGETLGPGAVVALTGELGAGKTCFIRGLARGLGARTGVTSPTFVLINEYRGRLSVHHVDLYRLESFTEVMDLGIPELMAGDGVTLIEWADKLGPLLPVDAIRVHVDGLGDEPRQISIDVPPAERR